MKSREVGRNIIRRDAYGMTAEWGAKELRIINYELRSISLSYANSETKGRLRSKRNLPYLTILKYQLRIINYELRVRRLVLIRSCGLGIRHLLIL